MRQAAPIVRKALFVAWIFVPSLMARFVPSADSRSAGDAGSPGVAAQVVPGARPESPARSGESDTRSHAAGDPLPTPVSGAFWQRGEM